MNARALLLLLLLTVALALTPRYRRLGLILSAVLIVLMGWQLLVPTSSTVQTLPVQSTANTAQVTVIPPQQVQLNSVTLSGNGAPWQLVGSLTNQASVGLREVKLQIVRRSCESEAQPFDECRLVWQGEHTLQVKTPSGARQAFDVNVWSHDSVPKPAGLVRDQIQVVAASGYGQ